MENILNHDGLRFLLEDNGNLKDDWSGNDWMLPWQTLLNGNKLKTITNSDEIKLSCTGDWPVQIGVATLADSYSRAAAKDMYCFGWNAGKANVNPDSIIRTDLDFAFIPSEKYPILNLSVKIFDDPGQPPLVMDYNFAVCNRFDRIRIYELLLSEQYLFYAFAGANDIAQVEGLSMSKRYKFLVEVAACFMSLPDYGDFTRDSWLSGRNEAATAFRPGGEPATRHAVELAKKRLKYKPSPQVDFWSHVIK